MNTAVLPVYLVRFFHCEHPRNKNFTLNLVPSSFFSLLCTLREDNPEEPASNNSADEWAYPVDVKLLPRIMAIVDICPAKSL